MFWGLIMEPGRCYTQVVKASFHVSMAALDIANSTDEPVQIMCLFEGRNYLLCTVDKKDKLQVPLDLNFEAGTKVSFATNGKSNVHLTGYLTEVDDDELLGEEEEENEEDEQQQLGSKRQKSKKSNEGPPQKKKKTEVAVEEEEESDDEDFDISNALEDSDEDGEEVEEEEDEDGGEEDEDDDSDKDESSLSDEEEEVKVPVKPKQNGVAKKEKLEKKTKEVVPKQGKTEVGLQVKKQVMKGGVVVEDLVVGSSDITAKPGKFVQVYYEGRLKGNNKLFDSTLKGPGFGFRLGKGEVIKGWDIGVAGMKVGGKRRITCPPQVAYGPKGSPPQIPPNSTLVFTVTLKKVK